MISVKVELKEMSQAIDYTAVTNAYADGPFYCIEQNYGVTFKHPVASIFRVTEDSGYRSQQGERD